MPRTLDVFLQRQLIGKLFLNAHGQMSFEYLEEWLANPSAVPLSQSLPLERKRFHRNACRGFFAGVLPDTNQREILARNFGISAQNDFALLERIGGECAGAVTFIPEGTPHPDPDQAYRLLNPAQLADIIRRLPQRPLLAGEEGIRLSLAGAQNKIAVQVLDGQISVPLHGAPSTHILKPAIAHLAGVVFNEALCMRLAEAVGLNTAKVEVGTVENMDYLLVERYDRYRDKVSSQLAREHQEDFCQALGVVPEHKYQSEGGPSVKQCFDLVRAASSAPIFDLQALLDAIVFNWLIGNNDAHGKNFSLWYRGDVHSGLQTRLAPLYDLISTVCYPDLTPKMAMKLGGEYLSDRIRPANFAQLAEEAALSKPRVRSRVLELADAVKSKLPAVAATHPLMEPVANVIHNRCERKLHVLSDSKVAG